MDDQSDGPLSACQQRALSTPIAQDPPSCSDPSRLFIVCGRGRKVDDVRALFSTCGSIKHLHLALDRSKKSRGFAFLEYTDRANGVAAIEKFDQMKLDDGHILKVTVAKERPVGSSGKLKRDQHARQDLDEKTEGGRGDIDGGIEVRLPGKRQRSSPPGVALPLSPSRVTPAFVLLETHRRLEAQADAAKLKNLKREMMIASQLPLPSAESCDDEMMKSDRHRIQVELVLCAMLLAVEQHEAHFEASNDLLLAAYQQMISMPSRVSKQKKAGNLRVGLWRSNEEPDEENSTDSLASSIRSVSLVSTRMKARGSLCDALQPPRMTTTSGGVVPPHRAKHHLRRRRQSVDSSESSTEDASDGRRKRSNTTTSLTQTAHIRATPQLLSPPRKLSDRSDICVRVSPDALKVEIAPKKQCKRHSSDNEIEEAYRVAKQQATQERRAPDGFMVDQGHARPSLTDIDKGYGEDRNMKLDLESESAEPARTKLFFTSTYKFTEQELEAMFAVYGDYESTQLVRSFGRVKTMAYIRYSKPCTAAFVVKSFREESSGCEDLEQPEFMTLSFAHETDGSQLQQREKPAQFHAERALDCSSSLCPSLPNKPGPPTATGLPSVGKDRLWVLLLYDRFLATHMLSSVVSSLSGMEYMDIKVVKSTGEAQGVAFAKFDCDTNATQAALQLHQMELPLGSGKFLQAIVILAPSLFSTTHGGNLNTTHESLRLDHAADERVITGSSEDVDLRAVEARFAHLMQSTELPYPRERPYFHSNSSVHFSNGATRGDHQWPVAANVYSHSDESLMGLPAGHYPMQLVTYPPPPPPQQFQHYTNLGPDNYQQLPQHRDFGQNAPGWMETIPYYQGEAQQYPISCAREQEMALPVVNKMAKTGPFSESLSPSEQMSIDDADNNCSNQASCSIHVSTSEPLELIMLASALVDCPGVVSFAKGTVADSKLTGYMVKFSKEAQALEAQRKLDGIMVGGQMLRVTKNTLTRQRGSGGKARSGSGRRKRQRVDPRNRK